MKNNIQILGSLVMMLVFMASCQDKDHPNYQYMPNMYEDVGYETYGNYEDVPTVPCRPLTYHGSPYGPDRDTDRCEFRHWRSSSRAIC